MIRVIVHFTCVWRNSWQAGIDTKFSSSPPVFSSLPRSNPGSLPCDWILRAIKTQVDISDHSYTFYAGTKPLTSQRNTTAGSGVRTGLFPLLGHCDWTLQIQRYIKIKFEIIYKQGCDEYLVLTTCLAIVSVVIVYQRGLLFPSLCMIANMYQKQPCRKPQTMAGRAIFQPQPQYSHHVFAGLWEWGKDEWEKKKWVFE